VTGVQTCALPISPKPQNPKTPYASLLLVINNMVNTLKNLPKQIFELAAEEEESEKKKEQEK